MLETQRNVDQFFVIKNVSRSASAGDIITIYSDLTDGEGVWTTPGGQVVDNSSPDAASYPKLRYIQRSGTDLLVSDEIDVSTVTHYSITSYAVAAEQVDFIGYTGSANSITATDSNLYSIRLFYWGKSGADFQQQTIKHGVFKSGSSTNQALIAIGLVDNLTSNFKPEKTNQNGYVEFNALCSATVTAANCFDNDAVVVKGSEYITVGTDLQYNSTLLVVGDYIRLQGPAASTTALGNSVYIVKELTSSTVFKVDRPITEASGTYAAGDDELEVIPNATAIAADWGIKCTGVANKWGVGTYPFAKVRFDITLEDFGTTTATSSVSPTEGTGNYQQIAELEWFLQGNEGAPFRTGTWGPSRTSRSDVVSTETYDIMQIRHGHKMTSDLGKSNTSPKQLSFALAVTANDNNQVYKSADATSLVKVSDDWIVTSWAVVGMSVQYASLT